MTISEIIESLQTALLAKDYDVRTDPYADLENEVKLNKDNVIIILDESNTYFDTVHNGFPYHQKPKIDITFIKPRNDANTHIVDRKALETTVQSLINDLKNEPFMFKLKFNSSTPAEIIIGSVKCVSRIVEMEAETNWEYPA